MLDARKYAHFVNCVLLLFVGEVWQADSLQSVKDGVSLPPHLEHLRVSAVADLLNYFKIVETRLSTGTRRLLNLSTSGADHFTILKGALVLVLQDAQVRVECVFPIGLLVFPIIVGFFGALVTWNGLARALQSC